MQVFFKVYNQQQILHKRMNNKLLSILKAFPRPLRDNIQIKLWGFQTPLINYLNPKVINVDENRIELKIKLSRRANSNWNSMFMVS